ncbi:TetR/AcrR family transcriptional regulator [Actinoallomurus iriomotensis]|uniref:TetR family transcriptional regulator n=1 Tax=Actinoallomurus iriomotensis TaxID=478107 RepID=A0A9W6S2C2_9ACTN|nr:TetR/AcrR family transcriptional regulator [Actinoallomurus iriomotensis]GLY85814.1 TetR family transcriptional regulator [Actinoallomurus iriomotensis]
MPGTSRVRSAEDSRARILDAAEALFAEEGYDATPTSRVAERAGVYKGLVFHYFARKIDLLLALVDRVPIEQIASLETEVVPGDVPATLRNVAADFDVWYTRSSGARLILFREAATHPEVSGALAEVNAKLIGLVRRAVDGALADPAVPEGRRTAAATTFAVALLNHAHWRDVGLPAFDLAGIADLLGAGLTS